MHPRMIPPISPLVSTEVVCEIGLIEPLGILFEVVVLVVIGRVVDSEVVAIEDSMMKQSGANKLSKGVEHRGSAWSRENPTNREARPV